MKIAVGAWCPALRSLRKVWRGRLPGGTGAVQLPAECCRIACGRGAAGPGVAGPCVAGPCVTAVRSGGGRGRRCVDQVAERLGGGMGSAKASRRRTGRSGTGRRRRVAAEQPQGHRTCEWGQNGADAAQLTGGRHGMGGTAAQLTRRWHGMGRNGSGMLRSTQHTAHSARQAAPGLPRVGRHMAARRHMGAAGNAGRCR
jgi:hypothetical protein